MTRRERRSFTDEFKSQMVQLYQNGKPRAEILKEYDIGGSTFDHWTKQYKNTGSFREKDNLSEEQKELTKLRKENQRLLMENDILKQAALIMGRK